VRRRAQAAAEGDAAAGGLKDRLLAEIRAGKSFFYNTVVTQAHRIEVDGDRVLFTFLPAQRAALDQFDKNRGWLKELATRVAGRPVTVVAATSDEPVEMVGGEPGVEEAPGAAPAQPARRDLKAEALASSTVQAVLEVFPAEIRDVEEV
jgi:hypothetical protein